MLKVENITKIYHTPNKQVRALDEVSLHVDSGEFVAVEGPSGSGKSTLLLTAGSLLTPDEGQILIGGQNPYALSSDERTKFRAEKIGFVFQQFHLIPYLSVLENILTPSILTKGENTHEEAMQLIGRFGLTERVHHVLAELSTGERQRTALARAFINSPNLILADEPTGNLDRENAEIVIESLVEFANTGGSVFLVTHDASAVQYAHCILRTEGCGMIKTIITAPFFLTP
ncbi:MAG TPA: ABC transporter ATP-binding protein [Sedimentisphaerales bacterium]|nr:ABC transporter ATP-binding protein [Sedimentisphaerales bacterium]